MNVLSGATSTASPSLCAAPPRVTGALLALMAVLGFLIFLRDPPVAAFHAEASAALFFLLAVIASLPGIRRNARIPGLVTAFTLASTLLILAQVFAGRHDYLLTWVSALGYLTLFWVAATWGHLLAGDKAAADYVVERLAASIVLVAIVNSAIQLVQLTPFAAELFPFVTAHDLATNCRVSGNVNQANHANTLTWLALSGATYLWSRGRLHTSTLVVVVTGLLLSSALAGSRLSWLFSLVACAGLIFAAKQRGSCSKALLVALPLAFLSLALILAISSRFLLPEHCVSSIERFVAPGEQIYYSHRLDLIYQSFAAWRDAPWFGVGVGRFMGTSFRVEDRLGGPHTLDFYPHNLLLHILCEFGLVGLCVLLSCAAIFVIQLIRNWKATPENVLFSIWIIIILLHAMVELPLWYSYFLIPFAIGFGFLTPGQAPKAIRRKFIIKPVLASVAASGVLLISFLIVDYYRLTKLTTTVQAAMDMKVEASPAAIARYSELSEAIVVFRVLADLMTHVAVLPNHANIDIVRRQNERLIGLFPVGNVVAQSVLIKAFEGDLAGAERNLTRLRVFFGADAAGWEEQLRRIAESNQDFDGLSALLLKRAR